MLNGELACLKRMFNVAIKGLLVLKGSVLGSNPAVYVSPERESNERDRTSAPASFRPS